MTTHPKPKKKYPQSRKSVSVSGDLFRNLKSHCDANKKAMSEVVENEMRRYLKMPPRELPAKAEKTKVVAQPAPIKKVATVREMPNAEFKKKLNVGFEKLTKRLNENAKASPVAVQAKVSPVVPVETPNKALKVDPPSLPSDGQKSSNIVMF